MTDPASSRPVPAPAVVPSSGVNEPRVFRAMGITAVASGGVLLANLCSGVLIARLLDVSGKGTVTAILAWTQLVGWAFALGFPNAVTYLQSRSPAQGPRIVGTSLFAAVLFGALGLGAGEVLVSLSFADQSDEVRTLAQLFMVAVFLYVLLDLLTSVTAGDHDFTFLNVFRLLQPALYVVLVVAIAVASTLTVGWVLVAAAVSQGLVIALAIYRLARRIGIGAPSIALLRRNVGYGLKLQGGMLASLANHRLDVLIMPIYLSTTAIGLYSIAVSVSSMMVSLLGSVSLVVFPVASRAGGLKATEYVARALRMTLLAAAIITTVLFVVGPPLVELVYGREFGGSATALRILLFGYVCTAASSVLVAGLKASNRPLAASATQLSAIPVTLVGLALFLEPYGIEGAAVVSTTAYFVAFVASLVMYRRVTGLPIASLLSVRAVGDDVRSASGRIRRPRRGPATVEQ